MIGAACSCILSVGEGSALGETLCPSRDIAHYIEHNVRGGGHHALGQGVQGDTMHRGTSYPPTMAFNMRVTTPCLLLRTGLGYTSTYLWGLTDQILYLSAVSSPPSLDLGLFQGMRSRDVMLHVVCLLTVDTPCNFSATRQTLT